MDEEEHLDSLADIAEDCVGRQIGRQELISSSFLYYRRRFLYQSSIMIAISEVFIACPATEPQTCTRSK